MSPIDDRLIRTLVSLSGIAAIISVVIGCAALGGWIGNIPALKSILPGLPTMKANTALCFVFSGLSLFICARCSRDTHMHYARRAALLLACAVTVIAAITLGEYLLGWNAGIDKLLFYDAQSGAADFPGRMSAATALNFLLIGSALLLYCTNRQIAAAQGLSAAATIISLVALLAYLFGSDLQRASGFSTVAVHTAATFLVLSGGLLNLNTGDGWMRDFVTNTISARLGRRFLAGTLVVLPLLAGIMIVGQRYLELYGTYFRTAILTVASMTVLALLNWFSTRMGNDAEEKISHLNRVYATLSGINTLIVRVRDKEQLYTESCLIARTVGKFPWVWIATIDESGKQASLAAWNGANDKILDGLKHRLSLRPGASGEDGLVLQSMTTKRPVIVNNLADFHGATANDLVRNEALLKLGIRSLALLPLVVAGKVAGIFALHAEEPDFFDAQEMNLLTEMAGDIAFALDNIQKEETFNYLAYYDPITGLSNRSLFLERLGRELKAASRASGQVALVLGDLKRFRMINETFGRHTADELLKQVAARLREHAQYPDNLSRLHGDCFATFVPSAGRTSVAHRVESLMGDTLRTPFMLGEQLINLEAVLGISIFPDDGENAEILVINAEAALKKAKILGEPYLFYKPEINAEVSKSLKLENKLRKALELGQFVLHYQPKVDFNLRTIDSVEALIRWNDPETGLVPPGQFIGLMEDTGIIKQVGAWALQQAVADIKRWHAMGLKAPRCAVNVSAIQLRDPTFTNTVIDTLEGFKNEQPLLDIEITESLIMENVSAISVSLNTLRGVGVQVYVDDFGTGYSSLAYLARLPINALKIDRAFIMEMNESGPSFAIVESIITLAHSLRLKVIAEGVETEEQADTLRKLNCDLMQGFLFCKPLPFEELAARLPRA